MGRLLTIVLGLLVALAPLALGSNRPLPWAYNALMAGLMAIFAAGIVWTDHRRKLPLRGEQLAMPLLLWGAVLAWATIQLLPSGLPSLAHPVWANATGALGGMPQRITVNADQTLAALMRFLTYTSAFLGAYVCARDADRANLLLRIILGAGAAYAVYGFLRYGAGIDKLLWFDQPRSAYLTGPFINRNTAATYFGIASCISFVFLLRRARHVLQAIDADNPGRGGIERLAGAISGRFGVELVLFSLLLSATILTQSRAGVMAAVVALLFGLVVQYLRAARRLKGKAAAAMTLLGGLISVAVILELTGARVLERMAGTQIDGENRLSVYLDTLGAIRDHAWMGSGLGTFQDVFPIYRIETPPSDLVWDKAHNDYLEVLLGLGVVFGGAVIVAIASLQYRCLKGAFARRRNSHMPAAAAMSCVLAGLHALFDFSLQIQAVAMTFAVVMAVGTAQSISDRLR